MLPLQQAYEVKHSILEYLKATFSFRERKVWDAFFRFVEDPEEGMFKGPYVSLKLPFVKSAREEDNPLVIRPSYPPYDHQLQSFKRLHTTGGHSPQSTLITTGTSSGKTECFMFPVLDHCYHQRERSGIKVIILYPMNALATDQAKRLAEAIWNDPRLQGKITAGLFIGEGKDKVKFHRDMGPDHVIENRDTILSYPPDILLTNFKMLDYALMRNTYHKLWKDNLGDPSLLQFLVLDELHTYDGAQGTDVANLLRRLKLKLGIEKGQLCAVGTSATIGSGPDSKKLLTEYASKVFGETFDESSVISENRVTVDEFFADSGATLDRFLPRIHGLIESRLGEHESYEEYIRRQKRLWQLPEQISPTGLSEELKKLQLVRDLISLTSTRVWHIHELLAALSEMNSDFGRLPEQDAVNGLNPREEVIHSILALISEACVGTGKQFPFLYLQVQLWIRELSGVLREFNEDPLFSWRDTAPSIHEPQALPAYFCRECGASGWMGVKDDNKNHFSDNPAEVYEYFFKHHKNLYFINTPDQTPIDEYEPSTTVDCYLDRVNLSLHDTSSTSRMRIHAVRKVTDGFTKHFCPSCNTENSINIIGTRVATLSSITVSQVLASDLDPRPEKYRKLLAFTNSVQDAAHQAGFIEARNYGFTFRASLQKVLNQLDRPVSLSELQDEFIKYWKTASDESGIGDENAYYYRFLPKDYKGTIDLSRDYRLGPGFTERFKKEFDERIRWEVLSEFGFDAIIGRTLEKTGASAVRFDDKILKKVFPLIQAWLDKNNLAMIGEQDLLRFVHGILHRIRVRGGLDHAYLRKFRERDLSLWDLNWMKDGTHFLNQRFGKQSRLPKLVTTQSHTRGLLDTTFTNANNWFRIYYMRCFPMASNYHAVVNEFYCELFQVFEQVGLVNRKGNGPVENFALNPAAIVAENKVKHYRCKSCGASLNVAEGDTLTEGAKCLTYQCKDGSYALVSDVRPNYYQLVYNRNRSPRIYAAEHTGLLERKDRERKEFDFKERPRFNSLNAMVATSTLEMGINIGTLNTAINNSVPPLPSNFLQRVGRAGRESGSALLVNFAKKEPHDLYYYGEPRDMMEGDVNTPGCFLEAKEILFRHFFAFCLDTWTSEDPVRHAIPMTIRTLKLLTSDLTSKEFIVNQVLDFIRSRQQELLERFSEFYRPDLSDQGAVLIALKEFLMDDTFYLRLRKVFHLLKEEYRSLAEKQREIDRQIMERKLGATDEERKVLESEKKALRGLQRLIDRRSVIEHLTNVGMLPNYAFPETGVTLDAWVKGKAPKESESVPEDKHFEVVRSSKVALRELAPGNCFYSQGFRMDISGLNTYDWKEPGVLMDKRFCSNCDYLLDDVQTDVKLCPKCGDPSWGSVKNHHLFVKLSGVKSVNRTDKASLDDRSDDRDSSNYKISRHIKFDPNSAQGAYGMVDIPFGIEYVKSAEITEINLGLASSVDSNRIDIYNQDNVPFHGFVTCKYCGKSSSEPHRVKHDKNFSFHYGYCKHKDRHYAGGCDDVFEEVYLFREMRTEVLRILLPVQEFESEAQLNMFKAGIELGLRKFYKGNPQHLDVLDYAEYNKDTAKFDRFLILYDQVPGGTGYLEKLFDPNNFKEVIQRSYEAIRDCTCKNRGKDGCYRCIYSYTNQRIHRELSRERAEKLFKQIFEQFGKWEKIPEGLGALTRQGQIEESELEERFVRALKHYLSRDTASGNSFEFIKADGYLQYFLKFRNGDYVYTYLMRPQHELGTASGVALHTRADFYIALTRVEKNGVAIDMESLARQYKNIAIYLDGYTYHASKSNLRFYDDLAKRMAIVASGDKISWTLTWNDLNRFEEHAANEKLDQFAFDKKRYDATRKTMERTPHWGKYSGELVEAKNNLERLIWLLRHPLSDQQADKRISLMLALRQEAFCVPSIDVKDISEFKDPFIEIPSDKRAKQQSTGELYMIPDTGLSDSDFARIRVAIKLKDLSMSAIVSKRAVTESLDKRQWEVFWQLFNLVQGSGEEFVNS